MVALWYNEYMNIKDAKIVFLGTPNIAGMVLSKLLSLNSNVVAVLTQPEKSFGRGLKSVISPVGSIAAANNLLLYQPKTNTEIEHILSDIGADVLVVVAYGRLLSNKSLCQAKFGAVNVHGSLLPKYRGPSPIQATILEGDKKTGTTFIEMTEGMDTGPILSQQSIYVNPKDTTASLSEKISKLACDNIEQTLNDYLSGNIKPQKQDERIVTYCHLITKDNGLINWQDSAETIQRQVRAYNPWPQAFTFWGKNKLAILDSNITKQRLIPGHVRLGDGRMLVGTSTSALEILNLQPSGKKMMAAHDFVNGHQQIDNYIL